MLGTEVPGIHLFQPLLDRKLIRAVARQHHVARFLHDRARQADGIPGAGHAGHRAGLARGAIHDGGIELVASVRREYRAPAGIKERIVLEHTDRGLDRIEARTPAIQHLRARLQSSEQAGAIRGFTLGGE